jgi:hypothetical protein
MRKPPVGGRRSVSVAAVIIAAATWSCGGVGSPAPSERPCVDLGSDQHIYDVTATRGGSTFVVEAESGPFGGSDGERESFSEIAWPSLVVRPLFSEEAHGSAVAEDGVIYWLKDDGIWAKDRAHPDGALIAQISDAQRAVISWTVDANEIVVLNRTTGGAVDAYPRVGGAARRVFEPDADAYGVSASADGAVIVITRHPEGSHVQFVIHANGTATTIDSGEDFPTFEWLSADGRQLVYLSKDRGLVAVPIDGSTSARAIDPSLPKDFNAISHPTSSGLVAYSGRNSAASRICFGSIPEASGSR